MVWAALSLEIKKIFKVFESCYYKNNIFTGNEEVELGQNIRWLARWVLQALLWHYSNPVYNNTKNKCLE